MAGNITISLEGYVASVTLANAHRRNAMSLAMWHDLALVFTRLGEQSGVRAVVIRGDPEGQAFCSGADVSEFAQLRGSSEDAVAYKERTHAALEAIDCCPIPTLALVDGPCIGGGLEIALAADLRYGSERSMFGLPIVRLSNTADLGDIARLVHLVGPGVASEVLFAGSTVSAERAYGIGLLNWVGPSEELEGAASDLIGRIIGGAPRAVRVAKQGLRAILHPSPNDSVEYAGGIREVLSGHDFQEGTRAFLERRPPEFTGE